MQVLLPFLSLLLSLSSIHAAPTNPLATPAHRPPPLSTPLPALANRAVGGWCGVHVVQYQKNEGPGGNTQNYRFDVTLYDGAQNYEGQINLLGIPSGQSKQISSGLPHALTVWAGNVDQDPVGFSYNGVGWNSLDRGHCSVGLYDSGKRQIDCGFSC